MVKRTIIIALYLVVYAVPAYGSMYVSPIPTLNLVLDPTKSSEGFSYFVIHQMCDRLVAYDETLNIVPQLAVNWSVSKDGLKYTFRLRENVTFHDGHPLTAEDVVWSLNRMLRKASSKYHELAYIQGAAEFHTGKSRDVSGVRAVDDMTVEVVLMRPYPPTLSVLSAPGAEIFRKSRKIVSQETLFSMPVCAGPYKIIKRTKDALTLQRHDGYYRSGDRIEYIQFRMMNKEDAVKCFSEGQCHDLRWYHMSKDELKREYTVESDPVAHINIIAFNTKRFPFSKPEVRRAIAMALDVEKLRKECYADKMPAHGYIPRGLGGYDIASPKIPYDLIGAKKLLENAKLPKSVRDREYVLVRQSNYMCKNKYERFIRDALRKIGLNVVVKHVSTEQLVEKYYLPRDYDMMNITMTSDYPEAYFLLNYFRSDYPHNFMNVQDSELDRLLEKSTNINNRYKRYSVYREIQERVLNEAYTINMYHDVWTTYYQKGVRGYRKTPLAIYETSIRDMSLDALPQ